MEGNWPLEFLGHVSFFLLFIIIIILIVIVIVIILYYFIFFLGGVVSVFVLLQECSVNESAAQHVIALGGLHRGEEKIQAEGKDLESWTNSALQVYGRGEWEKGGGLACVMYAQDLLKLLTALAADSDMCQCRGQRFLRVKTRRDHQGGGLFKVCFGVFEGFHYQKSAVKSLVPILSRQDVEDSACWV